MGDDPAERASDSVHQSDRDEADRARDEAAEVARAHALDINDAIVQGLASVIYTLERGDHELALNAARRTMAAARSLMSEMIAASGGDLGAGRMVREQSPVSVLDGEGRDEEREWTPSDGGRRRVLIVDDATDLRAVLRTIVSRREQYEVVGEATDGASAIEAARALRPDVILLDLAMPIMDGFDALPHLRELLPAATIIVLSGFNADALQRRAIELGADGYVEKGTSSVRLAELLDEIAGGSERVDDPEPEPTGTVDSA